MTLDNGPCTCAPARPPFDAVLDLSCPIHGEAASKLVVEAIDRGKLIAAQPPGRCDLCGEVEETRPYGPNGEDVCFACGMKDEDAMKRAFETRMSGS